MVYMLISCEHGKEATIVEKLQSIKVVIEIQRIAGNYDILIKLESMTIDILKEIINWKIRKMDGIRSTTTLVCSETSNGNHLR